MVFNTVLLSETENLRRYKIYNRTMGYTFTEWFDPLDKLSCDGACSDCRKIRHINVEFKNNFDIQIPHGTHINKVVELVETRIAAMLIEEL